MAILVLMAATSHDFWLASLTAPVWKALHMLVDVAYGPRVRRPRAGFSRSSASVARMKSRAYWTDGECG